MYLKVFNFMDQPSYFIWSQEIFIQATFFQYTH